MTNWQIYRLLSFILGGKDLESHVETLNASYAWEPLLSLSSHQMVTSQLGVILKSDPTVWNKVPSEEASYLDEIVSLNAERNQQIIEQTKKIIHSLNDKGISPLIMKGTALLLESNERPLGYRMQLDIDLLAHPKDMAESIRLIKGLGYQYAKEGLSGLEPVADEFANNLVNSYKDHKHLPPLLKQDCRAAVELHRHLYSKRYQKNYPLDNIFKNAELIKKDGLSWYRMNCKDEKQLLLTGGYIEPRLKASFSLPHRLVRDFLDFKEHSEKAIKLKNTTYAEKNTVQKQPARLAKAQEEAEILMLLISNQGTNKQQVKTSATRYLEKFELIYANPRKHNFVHNRAAFVRKLINFSHNPRLLLKRLN